MSEPSQDKLTLTGQSVLMGCLDQPAGGCKVRPEISLAFMVLHPSGGQGSTSVRCEGFIGGFLALMVSNLSPQKEWTLADAGQGGRKICTRNW